MINRFITSTLLVLSAFVSTASAQNALSTEMLLAQPEFAKQLEGFAQPSQSNNTINGTPTADTADTANSNDIADNNNVLIQSAGKDTEQLSVVQEYFKILVGQKLEIFGASEFSQQQDNQLLFFNTIGQDYRLAPGDVIRVTLRGLGNSDQSYKIGNSGQLILPDLPPISVSGLTIREVKNQLQSSLQIDDASASVFISLETARLITVQVSGAVNQPRTLAVPAYTPLSRVLAYAGGVQPNGSLRNIVLRERNGNVSETDFYDFLQSPVGSTDPVVTDSSRIFVPNQGSTVAAFGFVARPGIYELPTNQSEIRVRDLLDLSGTSILPPGLVIEAKYFNAFGISSTRTLELDDTLSAGEVMNLRFVKTRLQRSVTVTGAVLDEYSMASNDPISVRDLLKGGSTLSADAKLNFAIIIKDDKSVTAIDLTLALSDRTQTVPIGSTLVIFDNESYRRVLNADPIRSDDPLVSAVARANVLRVKLNTTTLGLLPKTSSPTISDVIDVLGLESAVSNLTDLVVIERAASGVKPMLGSVSLASDFNSKLPEITAINFWTNEGLDNYLLTANEKDLRNLFQVTVPLFVDYELKTILSPSAANSEDKKGLWQNIGPEIYSLFSIINSYDPRTASTTSTKQTVTQLLKSGSQKAGDQVLLFSSNFISDIISTKRKDPQQLANPASSTDLDTTIELEAFVSDTTEIKRTTDIVSTAVDQTITAKAKRLDQLNLTQRDPELLLNSLRIITGAVQRPGGYPVAGNVSLGALLEVAGGLLPDADSNNLSVQYLTKVDRSLVKGKKVTLRLQGGTVDKTTLVGRYFIEVPFLTNESATGVVTISGEVLRPGEYVIARDETIHDVIKRAGGLSPVAYPLGAIFARASLRDQERDNNALLANQLEQAVLQVSGSDNENAAEQAQTLLAYAQKLRAQPTVGRLSVNIISPADSAPVYSQNGDTLFVPKRPSHVSILGAVNKSTSASYAPGKSLDAYLRSAGGVSRVADLKRSYLLLPNGENTPLTRQMPIPPGSAIVIVPKTDKLSIIGITDLVSRVLGNIATSVLAINNVR